MSSFLDKNLAIIKKGHPGLEAVLGASGPENARSQSTGTLSINVIDAKDANKVPEIVQDNKKLYLHSKFNPIKEAERFIAQIDPGKFDLFVVMGFAFGYHIEELAKKISPDATLLVLEKSVEIFGSLLSHRDLTGLLTDTRLNILLDPDEDLLAETLKGKSSKRVTFILHRGSHQLYPDYYSNIKKIAGSYLSTKDVNIATLSKFEKTWSSNIARNIMAFISSPGANIFYDKFKDIPALVIGAGPSLTDSLEFIKENKNNAIIIAVDTSYGILKKNNIEPHFCITVDPQVVNARYFEKDTAGKTILITDPAVHPTLFRLYRGNRACTGMAFQMMKWIEDITGDNGELAYGGSVSTNAYDFAGRLGAKPVILVGQDMAFSDGLAHARGSYLDEEVRLKINRLYNPLMFNRYQLTVLPQIFVPGIDGGKIATNQKLSIFLNWFEKRNDENLINATPRGALLKGVKHVSFADLEFSALSFNIFNRIYEIFDPEYTERGKNRSIVKELLDKCEAMSKELNSLLPVLERSVSLSEELLTLIKKKNKGSKIQYILNKLAEVDKTMQSRDTVKDMISFTIQRVIHTITEGYEIDDVDESLSEDELVAKRSNYLYKGLLEGATYNKKTLGKMITLLSRG